MPNDPILHLLGLAKKAGRLELGEEPVGAACRARHARLILLAGDAAPNTCRRCAHFGEAGNVLWLPLPHSKQELGLLFGRKSCAMLAITDFGFAAAVADKLALLDPERYGAAQQQLREKADRALQRQREKRQHEKNLQRGKKHPWAPPPKQPPRPPAGQGRRGEGPGTHPPQEPPHSPRRQERPHRGAEPATAGKRPGAAHPPKPARPAKPAPGTRRLTGTMKHKP